MLLVQRILFPQVTAQLGSPSMAVRQEHLTLLRTMVVTLPERFRELGVLASDNPEQDFFLNAAHLQVGMAAACQ